ncbi:MAG: chain length determinant protein tyrosine kinase EpsG [Rhodocyclaceae bacterium]|nr:MAG: chain length determinant protein tyrosine kinase EpsG [Rhodocyclaceae bacterium]
MTTASAVEKVCMPSRGSAYSIGAILVDARRLAPLDAERILHLQRDQGLRFGDAGLRLGLLTEADIQFALARQYDYPYLVKGEESQLSGELVAAFEPFSPLVESLRALRSQLMLRWFNGETDCRALAVVSPQSGDGRSYLAANLAIVFSQLGEHTLLMDADMRKPRQHELFHLDNQHGLSSMLSGRNDAEAVQRVPGFMDLSVLTAGPLPPNPQELLGRGNFSGLLAELNAEFDVIVIDTPPGVRYADAQTLCVKARAALLATRCNHTRLDAASDMATNLSRLGVRVVGGVLSDF